MNPSHSPAPLDVRLFGAFDVLVHGRPLPALRSRRERWLLALLVLRHAHDSSRENLADALWPDNHGEQALFYLRKSLSNLRQALGPEAARLRSPSPRTLRLDMSDAYADVIEFDRSIANGGKANLEEAVSSYRGPLMPDCHEEWMIHERGPRDQAYLTALERLANLSDPAAAIRWLRLLVAADPYRESAHRALMQALSDCGDRAAVTVVFRELGERLHHDLNSSPSPETEQLYRELRHREPQVVVSPASPSAFVDERRHLPVPLTELIGRSQEIVDVLDWMKERRLITLVGPGGIGKTRLSIAVAEAGLARFQDGAWFLDLAPLADPRLLAQTVSRTLGLPEDPMQDSVESLVVGLRELKALLVFDNCEHLAESCAELVQRVLGACPGVGVLATSRQPLHVSGEHVLRVHGLPVPPLELSAASELAPSSLLEYEAVRLFVDRGIRVDQGFQLDRRNMSSVVQICHQLDGIPLAIELAAARLRSLSANEVNQRLGQRFQLLKSSSGAAIPRQQTLRSLIDWSYDLLNDGEKALLCRLSVFTGGWTLEAAEQVCSGNPFVISEVLDILTSLVDKSLVIAEKRSSFSRYRMLETVRSYALEKLTSEAGAWRNRHLSYFVDFVEAAEPNQIGPEEKEWLDRAETEHDNLRSAFAWVAEGAGEPELGLRMCGAMLNFRLARGYYEEGRTWCRIALDKASKESRTASYTSAINCEAVMAYKQGDIEAARALHMQCLEIRRSTGDMRGVAQSLNGLGVLARTQGDFESTAQFHKEAYSIRRELKDPLLISQSLGNLGDLAFAEGEYDSARALLEESLSVLRVIGSQRAAGVVLQTLGSVLLEQGDFSSSRAAFDEALSISRRLDERTRIAECLMGLGQVALSDGDCAAARQLLEESLSIRRDLREPEGIALSLESLAEVAAGSNQLRAAQLWGAAESLWDGFRGNMTLGEQKRHAASVSLARSSLGNDLAFEKAWQTGRSMDSDSAVLFALSNS